MEGSGEIVIGNRYKVIKSFCNNDNEMIEVLKGTAWSVIGIGTQSTLLLRRGLNKLEVSVEMFKDNFKEMVR